MWFNGSIKNVCLSRVIFPVLFFLCLSNLKSQNGLEDIIVEKYYISGPNDTTGGLFFGKLPIGSTTYRIYLDMLSGYRFYAAYGSQGHELRMETTTFFFNQGSIGNKLPNVIPQRTLKQNTVMLDSWLSAGAAGEELYAILKEQDDTIETVIHEKKYLQNNDKRAGIPLTKRDGLLLTNNAPWPSFFGIDSLVPVFFNDCKGSVFSTSNGAWGCLGGSVGADSLTTNRVLIAQITTNGDFSFKLNIQIGKPNGIIERYVAENPAKGEIQQPFLIYSSRDPKLTSSKNKKRTTTNK